ncbi:MAG: phosphoesterase [Deltaproteobacteria bacterium HGW-Deltaproteobacteria-13]|jgi:protein-tyrosine phosphatase|nr:MAG: phosphoesterase [Deltaproteobacteria bacterium HGW-Deltaproteobacteria-13]
MYDYHSHILPGIDDGPADIDDSVTMAAALRKAGFSTIYGTPHLIKGSYEADNEAVLSAASTLQTRLNAENIDLKIFPGREYYLDEFLGNYLKNPLTLGDTRYILIEIPNHASTQLVKETCFRIKCSGFIPMIAHPERCSLIAMAQKQTTVSRFRFTSNKQKTLGEKQYETALLDYLKDIGCAFQGNFGSFDAWYGPDVQQTANYLKKMEIYTHFGTDVHSMRGVNRLNLSHTSEAVTK